MHFVREEIKLSHNKHGYDGARHQVGLGTSQAWRALVDRGGHALLDGPALNYEANHEAR